MEIEASRAVIMDSQVYTKASSLGVADTYAITTKTTHIIF